jgi:hypothetical protein
MKTPLSEVAAFALLLAICTAACAQDFKAYPGSKLDSQASRQASAGATQCEVYTSHDSFDKLYAFYKGLYKETSFAPPAPTLPSGKKVQWSFFILDGGKDLAHSKFWLKIQHPYIGTIGGDSEPDFKDVRDISLIQTIHRH